MPCSRTPALLAAALLTLPAAAQTLQVAGNLLRATTNSYSRGPFGINPGEMLQRFDAGDLIGYGIEPAFPGMHVIRGVLVGMRNFGGTDLPDVTLYTEDPARPDYPDLQHPLGGQTQVVPSGMPLGGTYVYFANPILAPAGRDLFVGIRFGIGANPVGGIYVMFLSSNTTASLYDLPGAGMPNLPAEANTYRLYRDVVTDVVTYGSRGQLFIDLLTTSPSGMAGTISNQPAYQIAYAPPGATTLLSGLHPDAANPPLNAGRADDVSFVFADWDNDVGSAVAFLASFDGFGPEQTLDALVPGSVGGFCLPAAASFVLGFGVLDTVHGAAWVSPIPPAVRLFLPTCLWAQQAIGFDAVHGTLRGSQCVLQRF